MREILSIISSIYDRIHDWHPRIKEFLGEYIDVIIAHELRHRNAYPEIHQLFNDLIDNINRCDDDNEKDFILDYLSDFGRDLGHDNDQFIDLLNLYELSNANSYSEFVAFLLNKCYEEDDYNFVSDICSYLRGHLPRNNTTIRDILLRCIYDRNKSNRLRERIFWIFSYDYRDEAIDFFVNHFENFLNDNFDNIDLNADIIEFIHWDYNRLSNEDKERLKNIVRNYINNKPEVKEKIISSITKEIFEI